jgi:hypothetical protein
VYPLLRFRDNESRDGSDARAPRRTVHCDARPESGMIDRL